MTENYIQLMKNLGYDAKKVELAGYDWAQMTGHSNTYLARNDIFVAIVDETEPLEQLLIDSANVAEQEAGVNQVRCSAFTRATFLAGASAVVLSGAMPAFSIVPNVVGLAALATLGGAGIDALINYSLDQLDADARKNTEGQLLHGAEALNAAVLDYAFD